jgi:uncharacterized membrane protein
VFDGTGVRELGALPGAENSSARAINDAGRIVGSSFPSAHPGEWRAFVYDLPRGPMLDVSPDRRCELSAVNSGGVAVGTCASGQADELVRRAAILRGEMVEDLNDIVGDPSWVFSEAQGINDAGQIAGSGLHDGQPRGFVLTPP